MPLFSSSNKTDINLEIQQNEQALIIEAQNGLRQYLSKNNNNTKEKYYEMHPDHAKVL